MSEQFWSIRTIRAIGRAAARRPNSPRSRANRSSRHTVRPIWTRAASTTSAISAIPGQFPFTRGVHETLYRGKPWTMRMFAGFGSAEETNARFRYLLEHGETGLSIAFDLPTLYGRDTDDPLARRRIRQVRRRRVVAGRHGGVARRHSSRCASQPR